MEITKSLGSIKQCTYDNAELKSTNVKLVGEVTINKDKKVTYYNGRVEMLSNGVYMQIGTFSYALTTNEPAMYGNGVSITITNSEYMSVYPETAELLKLGVIEFETATEPVAK